MERQKRWRSDVRCASGIRSLRWPLTLHRPTPLGSVDLQRQRLTLHGGASRIRRGSRRHGARFKVEVHGQLKLCLPRPADAPIGGRPLDVVG